MMAATDAVQAAKAVETVAVEFASHDGFSRIRGTVWLPRGAGDLTGFRPRAIVQLVHGMSEHIARYDAFARFLAAQGFVVCGHDHIGHGKSVASADDLGHLPARGGKEALIADVHELRQIAHARYGSDTPYLLFGHSMGSFIAYAYLARHADGLVGAVLCGTGRMPTITSRAGNLPARALCALRGERYVSKLLDSMGAGAYSKRIPNARTAFDWLSCDPSVVDAYIADDLCGRPFTAGGYATLTDLTYEIATAACAHRIPRNLPILLIAGSDDPVGDCGAGVERARDLLVDAGASDVTMTLYPGMRHEILNEPDRERVFEDVLAWMEGAIGR